MSIDHTINAYFVTTSFSYANKDNHADENAEINNSFKDIQLAINYLKEHVPEENIRQIKSTEGFPLIASGKLTKQDVFIFDRFEGDFFRQLQQTKSLIIGPSCLITCLQNDEPIPMGVSPVYTNAMQNLNISASGITPAEKERLRTLIEWMGGHYFQHLGRSITHLISNTIKSSKYEYATLNGIPVMHTDWVQRIWERSCAQYNIKASDKEFDKYKLPILFGVNVTCTALKSDKKNEIMRLVNENGGTYHGTFRPQFIDIVITDRNKCDSEKYQAALRYKKDILTPEWIIDSIDRGFALPTKPYQVKSLKVSTPTKTDQAVPDFTLNDHTQMSDISRIGGMSSDVTTVNDTVCSNLNETQKSTPSKTLAPSKSLARDLQENILKKKVVGMHYQKIYEEICPKKAKKAGNFLDGCSIYLSGFRTEEKEKLNRILNVGGATRYNVLNENITHIIVGQLLDAEFNTWKKQNFLAPVHIVRLDWLLESIQLKCPANEAVYRVSLPIDGDGPDAPSPSSKRTLRSMNHSFKQPIKPIKRKLFNLESAKTNPKNSSHCTEVVDKPLASSTELPLDVEEENLIAQYSQENQPIATVSLIKGGRSDANKSLTANATLPEKTLAAIPLNPTDVEGQNSQITIDYENLNFFQGMSLYIHQNHFPEEFYLNLVTECEAVNGNVVPVTFQDPVDFAIVSFERTLNPKCLPVKAKQIITELYMESCIKDNKLVPIEYYHKHIPHTADARPLNGMIIVISTYSDLERDFIDSLAQLLGATVNKTFVKKEKPLLVCPTSKGSKYEGAIKWNYPIVTSAWLLQCAQEGKKLPYKDYLVEGSPVDFPISPISTIRDVNAIMHDKSSLEQKKNKVATPILNEKDCPMSPANDIAGLAAEAYTPLRNKRVLELASQSHSTAKSSIGVSNSNSYSTVNSPHTPLNGPSYNFHFLEKILAEIEDDDERECLKEVLEEMRMNHTPELERIRRQACTPIRIPTPKGIPEFCTTPEFEKRMADEFERRWRLPTKKMKADTPIEVIRRRILKATCKAMGIPYDDDDKDDNNKYKENQKETPMQISSGSKTPTSRNLSTSRNQTALEPRSLFSDNINANHENISTRPSIGVIPDTQSSCGDLGKRASLNGKSTLNFDKITFDDSTALDYDDADAANALQISTSNKTIDKQKSSTNVKDSPEMKQITDYLRNCETRRQNLKRSFSNNVPASVSTEMMESDAHFVQPFESEQLQTEELVGWRDPADFINQRRTKPTESTTQHQGTPCFSISCADELTRDDIISKILQLGGEICENLVNYDPECTHFLIERPNRAEKMLGCISSGKWILSHKYIEQCFAKGVFIDEELYEWGNSKAVNLPHLTSEEQIIALAAYRWRKTLSSLSGDTNGKKGAFSGFRAILHITGRNVDALKNVIRAGNGEVIEAISPYKHCSETKMATHCFVDIKKSPLHRDDLDYFKRHNILVLTQMYINAYLMNGSDVDITRYEIN